MGNDILYSPLKSTVNNNYIWLNSMTLFFVLKTIFNNTAGVIEVKAQCVD